MKRKIDRFSAGGLVASCCLSIIQDLYGKEAYIEHIKNHWVSGLYTLPLAIIIAIITILNMEDK